jgi:hypothetical protein
MQRSYQRSPDAASAHSSAQELEFVMAGLDPAIHGFLLLVAAKTWMPGTSPGLTNLKPNSIGRILSQTLS